MSPDDATGVDRRSSVGQHLLENGLHLIWEEDHTQPLVAIEARIRGGLRAEGRWVGTGITHLTEHMLFKGTPSRPPGSIEQEVRRYGGSINAFTSLDATGVSLYVESRHVRQALELLADILQHTVFEEKEFDKEREVVKSEIQMNLDDPSRRLRHLFWNRHFLEHPYRHPILGYESLLSRLTVDDLRAFFASQYQPQNLVIACAGDLEGDTVRQAAEEIFAAWPRGLPDPLQHLVPSEPAAVSVRQATVEMPVQVAYVLLGFSTTRLSDPDVYATDVLASILGQGRSSRLHEALVREQRLAHRVGAGNETPYDPGVLAITLWTDPDKVEAAVASVQQILEDLKGRGVKDAEVQKAKNQVRASYLFGLQTIEAKAGDLANSAVLTGDPLYSWRYVEGIEQVTADQVREVARRYLDGSTMTRVAVVPMGLGSVQRAERPVPSRPQVTKARLPNGLTVLIGTDRRVPIASVVVAVRGGIRVEDDAHQGLSNLVAQMLTKGTTRRGASEIAELVESLGGSLEPFSGRDGFGLSMQVLAGDLEEGIRLVHELVMHSTFPVEELSLQKDLVLQQLEAQEDEIFDMGGKLLRQTLFVVHPYRFQPLGAKETIRAASQEMCLAFVKQWLVPSNMVIAVFGDLDPATVHEQMTRLFGRMPAQPHAWPEQLAQEPLDATRSTVHTMEREQALVLLGFRGSTWRAPERYALDVMTTILAGMAGRLFQSVRNEQGLAYTLGAYHEPGWDPGYLVVYAATRPEEQARVLGLLDEQLRQATNGGFTQEEVDESRRSLIGAQRLELQHLGGLTRRSAIDELYGLGYDAWMKYEAELEAVTVPMVNEAARRYLTLDRRAQVIVSPDGAL